MSSLWGNSETKFFFELGPDEILRACDSLGLKTTGRVMQLNSMENRVYEVEIESDSPNPSEHFKIIKFYRPGRWTIDQIQEEHDFLQDLEEFEVPVIGPDLIENKSLFVDSKLNLNFALFRKQGGRAPDEFTDEDLEQIGRLLARVHNIGATKKANFRLHINAENFVKNNCDFLIQSKIIPSHLETIFKNLLETIYEQSKDCLKDKTILRIHGDCHLGNVIRRESVFHLIDFDDFIMGPAVQDIWLLLPGRDEYTIRQRQILIEAYESIRDFNHDELKIIEHLRTFRMINFAAWIAKRYDDPAFKNAFPYFESPTFWEEKINDFRDQLSFLNHSENFFNH
jgi:Ser/Thr protein kinase RdoA (MazF antagonist)